MRKYIFTISAIIQLCLPMAAQTYSSVTIKTPNGSTVPDVMKLTSPDLTYNAAQLAAIKADIKTNYNGAELIDAPSLAYNCHAYAWHVSEGGEKVWIGYETRTAEDIYWTDGSYIEVSESQATKVSYNEDGNHSAIRLNSTWYQSKWGSYALVKHHPNDVPVGYCPTKTKKYYKRNLPNMSITGSTFICNYDEYVISNLPENATVSWEYTSIYGNAPTIQSNTPSTNSCTVRNTYKQIFEGDIKANITISGVVVKQLTKRIYGDKQNFVAFYWEASDDGSWVPEWSVSLEEPNSATPPKTIIVESENFRGKNVSYSSLNSHGTLQVSLNNRISFEMPSLPENQYLTINVTGSDCSDAVSLKFMANKTTSYSSNLQVTTLGTDKFELNFTSNPSKDSAMQQNTEWNIDVYNTNNIKQETIHNIGHNHYILDTTTWKPGTYILYIVVNGERYSKKIVK